MRLCYECCFPRRFSRFLDWHSDGTITGSIRPRIPLMFLEVAEWDTIYDELAMTIGAPIEHIVVEAQKYIGKDLYDMVKAIYWGIDARRVPNVRWLRPQWLARLLVWGMGDDMAGLGAGRARVESYLAGDHLTVRLINPCVVPMTLGSTQGIYESVEQMPGSKVGYRYEGEDLIVHLTHAEERPESEDRLYLEEGVAGSGPLEYERCSTCGTPIKASRRLSWALRRGEITNPQTQRRYDMIAVQSLDSTLRELERELGEEVIEVLYGAQKWYTAQRLKDSLSRGAPVASDFWAGLLQDMALMGLGYPDEFDAGDSEVSVLIGNAYNQDLYAAKIAAGLEALTGKGSRIEWRNRERKSGSYVLTAD
jgi:hypothetical protein